MALNASLLKFLKASPAIAGRSGPGSLRVLVTGTPGGPGMPEGMNPQMEGSSAAGVPDNMSSGSRGMASSGAAREVIDEAEYSTAEQLKDKAHDARQKADSMAEQMKDRAQDIGERAKQTVQGVWGSAKDTAQKVKETVVGKAEDAKEFIHEKSEAAEKAIKAGLVQGQMEAEADRNSIKASAFKHAASNPKVVEKAMNTKNS